MRIQNANELLQSITDYVRKEEQRNVQERDLAPLNQQSTFKLGTIPSDYTSGRPRIIFEGENQASLKRYPYLASYTPRANDIVLLAKVSDSYVILGKKI